MREYVYMKRVKLAFEEPCTNLTIFLDGRHCCFVWCIRAFWLKSYNSGRV